MARIELGGAILTATVIAMTGLSSCSSASSTSTGPPPAAGSGTPTPTPSGVEDYLVKACRYFAVRDVVRMFPTPPGMKRLQQVGPDAGECHWVLEGSLVGNEHRPRNEFGLIITARSPQYGAAPPASEPSLTNVPTATRAQVQAGIRQVHLGAATGWFQPYYSEGPGERAATHLDLSVGQYDLLIYADTTAWGDHYRQVEDSATANADLAAAEKIAAAVIARLPATPPAPG